MFLKFLITKTLHTFCSSLLPLPSQFVVLRWFIFFLVTFFSLFINVSKDEVVSAKMRRNNGGKPFTIATILRRNGKVVDALISRTLLHWFVRDTIHLFVRVCVCVRETEKNVWRAVKMSKLKISIVVKKQFVCSLSTGWNTSVR